MGIELPKTGQTVDVVLSIDTALDMTEEERALYRETFDQSLLKYKAGEEPTIFVLAKVMDWDKFGKVINSSVGVSKGHTKQKVFGNFERLRFALVDIKDPSDAGDKKLQFKRENDGGASKQLMSRIAAAPAVFSELLGVLTKIAENPSADSVKKS